MPRNQELQRICYDEANQVRKLKIEELSLRQERYPRTVSRLLKQIHDTQNQVNSLAEAKEFHDTDTASSSGASHVPSPPVITPSSRGMPRFWIAAHNTDTKGNSANVFESPPAREGSVSAIFESWRNVAMSSCGLRPELTEKTSGKKRVC